MATTSAALVAEAERHLLELLGDPYYREAYLRLVRKRDAYAELGKRAGILPRKGALAAQLQWPQSRATTSPAKPGTPKRALTWLETLLNAIDALNAERATPLSIADWSRRIARRECPHATAAQVQLIAKDLAAKLRDERKRQLGRRGKKSP